MEAWLIRTAKNLIAGPYTDDQVRELITTGQLQSADEICRANHYWIGLQDRAEVKKELGIDPPVPFASDPDSTKTETKTVEMDEKTDPSLYPPGGGGGGTRVVSSTVRRAPVAHVLSAVERVSIWRGLGWVLLGFAAIIALLVVNYLRRSGS